MLLKSFGKTWDQITQIIHSMRNYNLKPNVVTYRTAIQSVLKRGALLELEKLLEMMEEDEVVLDSMGYNDLIAGFANRGELDRALAIYGNMKDGEVKPTHETFIILMNAYYKLKDTKMMVMLVKEMMALRLELGQHIHAMLTRIFASMDDQADVEFFANILSNKMNFQQTEYGTLVGYVSEEQDISTQYCDLIQGFVTHGQA
jgi:pentatricopeptide repeat protein